jgi:hypothetical protein
MAKVWPVSEGREHTPPSPWAEIPLSEAIALFELRPQDFVSSLAAPPHFGNGDRDLWYAGFKHVVVEIEDDEGQKAKWKPGFYKSRIRPREARRRLIQQPLVAELGKDNVIRVEYEPTTDSQGRGALKITVVITPDATDRLANGVVLDALVRLRERLREMRDDRTPILEYATEAELAQDGGP